MSAESCRSIRSSRRLVNSYKEPRPRYGRFSRSRRVTIWSGKCIRKCTEAWPTNDWRRAIGWAHCRPPCCWSNFAKRNLYSPEKDSADKKTLIGSTKYKWMNEWNGLLWPPSVADADIIFLPCGFFYLLLLLLSFFHRLISAVAGWMSTICLHMVWP